MIPRLIFPSKLHTVLPQPFQCLPRLAGPSTTLRFGQLFSTTRSRYDNSFINHYEVLQVPQTCSHAELKKQFYTLSRQTHPDVNKTDPDASARFSQISESYSVLADPDRRKRYDRDVLRVHQQQHHSHLHSRSTAGATGGRSGSYAGSRPASGLSKRRGTFRGPPPSFYAHGGRDAPRPNNTTHTHNNSTGASADAGTTSSTGPGTAFTPPPNTDFDPHPIHRTQTHEDIRRQSRREAAMARAQQEMEDDAGFWVRFVVVTGLLVGGVSVAGLFLGVGGSGGVGRRKGGLVRGDGSRRDGLASAGGGNGTGNEWMRGGTVVEK